MRITNSTRFPRGGFALTIAITLALSLASHAQPNPPPGYQPLFDGQSFAGWRVPEGNDINVWSIDPANGILKREVKSSMLWTKDSFGNFVLELEFKLSRKANSGLFFRSDPSDHVQRGFEIQLMDTPPAEALHNRNIGALYNAQAASQNTLKSLNKWNHLKLRAQGTSVKVWINDQLVNEIDLARWTEPETNPDGSKNKFKHALNSLPHHGQIGLQNHGNNVSFRNLFIKEL